MRGPGNSFTWLTVRTYVHFFTHVACSMFYIIREQGFTAFWLCSTCSVLSVALEIVNVLRGYEDRVVFADLLSWNSSFSWNYRIHNGSRSYSASETMSLWFLLTTDKYGRSFLLIAHRHGTCYWVVSWSKLLIYSHLNMEGLKIYITLNLRWNIK